MAFFGALGQFAIGAIEDALAALQQTNNAGPGPLGQFALGEQGESDTDGDGLGLALENDSAFGLTFLRTYPLGLATETDSAFGLTFLRTYPLGIAIETDSALDASIFFTGKRQLVAAIAR